MIQFMRKFVFKNKILMISIGLITILVFSPIFAFLKSIVIMFPYAMYEEHNSLLVSENITVEMPGGITTLKKDWYPLVMVFNDSYGLSRQVGRDVELTILYNFGAFDLMKGCSTFYDEKSDYLNGFYGAYIVKDENRPFGYKDDLTPNFDEMALVPAYDMKNLVLRSIGKKDGIFDTELIEYYTVDSFLGVEAWDAMDIDIITNSPMHLYHRNYQSYIQYGKPNEAFYTGEDFREIELKGKTYCKYFPEKNVTVFFYILATTEELIQYTEENFVSKTKFSMD